MKFGEMGGGGGGSPPCMECGNDSRAVQPEQ